MKKYPMTLDHDIVLPLENIKVKKKRILNIQTLNLIKEKLHSHNTQKKHFQRKKKSEATSGFSEILNYGDIFL